MYPLSSTNQILSAFGGSVMKPVDVVNLGCKFQDKLRIEEFSIVQQVHVSLLSVKECAALGLIKRLCSVEKRIETK